MIKKILMVVAAVAMPIGAATAVGVVGTGVAGAAKPPPGPITCTQAGSVTFQAPGLSNGGTLTTKTSVLTKADVTPTGTGCSGTAIKVKIVSATVACPQTNGVPNSGDPSSCLASKTNGKGVVTYEISKKPNYYDTDGQFESNGLSDLQAALANGLTTKDNGNKVTLEYGSANEVVGGACGTDGSGNSIVGFQLTGAVDENGASTGLNYSDLVCLTNDSGTNTTGNFLNDLTAPASSGVVIASATIGGNSSLAITEAS